MNSSIFCYKIKAFLRLALISSTALSAAPSTKASRRTQNTQTRTIFWMRRVSLCFERRQNVEAGSLAGASHSGPRHRLPREFSESVNLDPAGSKQRQAMKTNFPVHFKTRWQIKATNKCPAKTTQREPVWTEQLWPSADVSRCPGSPVWWTRSRTGCCLSTMAPVPP